MAPWEEILNSPFFITLSWTHLHCYLLHERAGSFTSFISKHFSRHDSMPGSRDSEMRDECEPALLGKGMEYWKIGMGPAGSWAKRASTEDGEKGWIKESGRHLAGMAQWIEHRPANQRVTGQFPVRAHAWVAGQGPSKGCARGNHTLMFLSLSFSLSSHLSKINQSIKSKKKKNLEDRIQRTWQLPGRRRGGYWRLHRTCRALA